MSDWRGWPPEQINPPERPDEKFRCKDCDHEYDFNPIQCTERIFDKVLDGWFTCGGTIEELLPCSYCERWNCRCDDGMDDERER